jgi:hypothetical protein
MSARDTVLASRRTINLALAATETSLRYVFKDPPGKLQIQRIGKLEIAGVGRHEER